jgi:hypothetical protein
VDNFPTMQDANEDRGASTRDRARSTRRRQTHLRLRPAVRDWKRQEREDARPPLRPAAFFCAVVPPCDELLRELDEPDFFPPRLEEPEELAMRAARDFDIPLSLSASYCFSFLTLARLFGMSSSLGSGGLKCQRTRNPFRFADN